MIEEEKHDVAKLKHRIDYKFYSNILTVNVAGADAYIDFSQYPSENDELPTCRIFLTHALLKNLQDLLKNFPQLKEEKK
jgi:hypothetical protein